MRIKVGASGVATGVEWNRVAWYSGFLAAFILLLWFKLGSIVGGYSNAEQLVATHSSNLPYIFHNPINAPFLLLANGLSRIGFDSLLVVRAASMLFGLATLICFYGLLHHWQRERTAVIGTALFGCSAWFLHTTRLGEPNVLLFGILALTACYIWIHHKSNALAVLVGFLLTSMMLYVPGMIIFIVLGIILQWKKIDRAFKKNLWAVTLGAFIMIAALVPLGLAIYHDPNLVKTLAGLPADGWPMPLDVLKNFVDVPIQLFVKGPVDATHWLGHVPVVDFFTAVMFFLGAYIYYRNRRLGRVHLTFGIILVSWVLISLDGAVNLTIIVPFVYLVAMSGVAFMIDYWFTVFPRNTIAQTVGLSLMGLALLAVGWYSFMQYFVAWPNAPATKQIFTVAASDTIKKQ